MNIKGIDTEACCGTHADNTAEVGWIKLVKTQRISDGIVRLYYVARDRAMQVINTEGQILHNLCKGWGVDQNQIEMTANRFFSDKKHFEALCSKQDQQILQLQAKVLLRDQEQHLFFVKSEQAAPTLYIGFLP